MLPKINRIKKRKEFEYVFKKGKASNGRFFIIKAKENELEISRFAFTCPIKSEKRAAKRNIVKRKFREAVKREKLNIKDGYDVIFIIKKEANNKNYNEIRKDIKEVFKKENLIKNG